LYSSCRVQSELPADPMIGSIQLLVVARQPVQDGAGVSLRPKPSRSMLRLFRQRHLTLSGVFFEQMTGGSWCVLKQRRIAAGTDRRPGGRHHLRKPGPGAAAHQSGQAARPWRDLQ
jgi:hypothetical protein